MLLFPASVPVRFRCIRVSGRVASLIPFKTITVAQDSGPFKNNMSTPGQSSHPRYSQSSQLRFSRRAVQLLQGHLSSEQERYAKIKESLQTMEQSSTELKDQLTNALVENDYLKGQQDSSSAETIQRSPSGARKPSSGATRPTYQCVGRK